MFGRGNNQDPPSTPLIPSGKDNTGYYFDASGFERAAQAAKELDSSSNAREAIELSRQREKTLQMEHEAGIKKNEAVMKQFEIEANRVKEEERRKTLEFETQGHLNRAKYHDELARKRHTDQQSEQLYFKEQEFKKQEDSIARQEAMKRKTIEYEMQLKRENQIAKAQAKAKGDILRERENRDLHLEQIRVKAAEQRATIMEAISIAGTTIGNGISSFLSSKEKLTTSAGFITALAIGIYGARTTTAITGRYIESRLGKPSLVRETSRSSITEVVSHPLKSVGRLFNRNAAGAMQGIVLPKPLETRLSTLAQVTKNTRRNKAPFRHQMFYGPPGTGKTMFAKSLARHSGMEYAILTGGDIAPLGKEAVTEIHKLFDWAQTSRKGLLLFVDEADAFLRKRSNLAMSEDMRNALNAFLFRTGEASDKFMVVLATNQPEQLDWAVADRVDELVSFPLPSLEERKRMLELYFQKYIKEKPSMRAPQIKPEIEESILNQVAEQTEGFSGREISKLAIAWQAAAYGTADAKLTLEAFESILTDHISQLEQKKTWNKGQ